MTKCTHDDCMTCPYPDCISKTEPGGGKRGRKKLPKEEKKKRRSAYNKAYWKKTREQRHQEYIAKTEGVVKTRYKTKRNDLEPRACISLNKEDVGVF